MLNFGTNHESPQKVFYAFKDLDKSIIAPSFGLGNLVTLDIRGASRESMGDTHREKDTDSTKNCCHWVKCLHDNSMGNSWEKVVSGTYKTNTGGKGRACR